MAVRVISAVSNNCALRGKYFSNHIFRSRCSENVCSAMNKHVRLIHSTICKANLWQHYADLKLCVEGTCELLCLNVSYSIIILLEREASLKRFCKPSTLQIFVKATCTR